MSQTLGLCMKNDQLNFPRLLSLLPTILVNVDSSNFTNFYEEVRINTNFYEFEETRMRISTKQIRTYS